MRKKVEQEECKDRKDADDDEDITVSFIHKMEYTTINYYAQRTRGLDPMVAAVLGASLEKIRTRDRFLGPERISNIRRADPRGWAAASPPQKP